jgi:hypothetical protein
MRVEIAFESMFGDGQVIAKAVAKGLSDSGLAVEIHEVGVTPRNVDDDVALLVVGGPNHAFGLSRESSRADAAESAPEGIISANGGIREWLGELTEGSAQTRVATWDTRLDHPRILAKMDHAAGTIRRKLNRLGYGTCLGEEHFAVVALEGPLAPGEEDRAYEWGKELAGALSNAPES